MSHTNESQARLILQALGKAAGNWVSMPHLVEVSGSYNIHTRIDELRHRHGHPQIENRCVRDPECKRRQISEYRLPITQP